MSTQPSPRPTRHQNWQQRLAQHCYWDEEDQQLWLDCRKLAPEYGVFSVPSWDRMMLSSEPIPEYPTDLTLLNWSNYSQLASWKKQIPAWVRDSCALFPSHQLKLLHYVGRYPQLLELLDHSPILAWRLMTSKLTESEIVALLSDKRSHLVEQVGWPGKNETFRFLRKLRLRQVDQQIADQVDVCLLDDKRLTALQELPRVNSMALSLAARFPEMIGCRLHLSLASMPCRPMQCQSMVALLEDAYRLAEYLKLPDETVAQIGHFRYLVEVEKLYRQWVDLTVEQGETAVLALSETPTQLTDKADWYALSRLQGHAWLTDWTTEEGTQKTLYAYQSKQGVVGFLYEPNSGKILRVRQEENHLPSSEQLSQIHLWQAAQIKS